VEVKQDYRKEMKKIQHTKVNNLGIQKLRNSVISSLLFLLIPLFLFASDGPTNNADPQDYADPQLKEIDKNIWTNFLAVYAQLRQIARSAMEGLNTASDFAWQAHKYLNAIERVSHRAQIIWDNINDFKAENIVEAIIYAEEEIFQNADMLFESDIPYLKQQRQEFQEIRDEIRMKGTIRLEALKQLFVTDNKLETKVKYLLLAASPVEEILEQIPDNNLKLHLTAVSHAATTMAQNDENNRFYNNQDAMLSATIANATTQDGETGPKHSAEFSKINNRNELILKHQEQFALNNSVKNIAYMNLIKLKLMEDFVVQKQLGIAMLERFAEELGRVE